MLLISTDGIPVTHFLFSDRLGMLRYLVTQHTLVGLGDFYELFPILSMLWDCSDTLWQSRELREQPKWCRVLPPHHGCEVLFHATNVCGIPSLTFLPPSKGSSNQNKQVKRKISNSTMDVKVLCLEASDSWRSVITSRSASAPS